MVHIEPMTISGYQFTATHVALPKTNLLTVSNCVGYIMCGALDIGLLRDKLAHRGIVAARATGVKTIQELIDGVVDSCTQQAQAIGIEPGMSMREALILIGQLEQQEEEK